ncbi:MAG: RCC1 domain-containing protein, partial [Pseudomonas sp.]
MNIQSSALNELFTLYPVIIMGWVTPVKPAGSAHGGIPKSLYDNQPNGLRCLIDPWTELQRRSWTMMVDDRADLYVNDDAFPAAGKDVGPGEEQLRMELFVPHGRLLNGVNRLHYKVTRPGGAEMPSRDLLVLYHLRAPGEPAPQGLDLVIPPDVIAGGVSAERAAQGVAFGFTYSNRRTYDRINFLIGNTTVPFEVLDGSVPVVHTLFTDTFVQAGDNPNTPLEFRVMDQLGNSSQSSIKYIDVHLNQALTPLEPSVKEASGAILNPVSAKDSLTIVVPPNSALLPGDKLKVTWTGAPGTPLEGSHTSGESLVSEGLEIPIPNSVVAFNLGKSVKVSYVVIRGNEPIPSLVFDLAVQTFTEGDLLTAKPKILEAANQGEGLELDLSTISANATCWLGVWPLISPDQDVWLRLKGTKADGTTGYNHNIWAPPPKGPRVNPLWISQGYYHVPAPYDYLKELKDGSVLTMEFKVAFSKNTVEAEAVVFPLRTYTIKALAVELPKPEVEGVLDGGILDPSQVAQVWTRVLGTALLEGDEVVVTWTDESGVAIPDVSPPKPYTFNDAQLGYLRFPIGAAVVQRFLDKSVKVTYTRDRNGSITGPSLPFKMRVETPVLQEPFKVMGARFNRTTYRASGSSRLLSALRADTLQPLMVEWKYADEFNWSAPSATWRDTQPSKPLQVRSSSHEATVNPANIFGSGADTLTNGGAAFVALLDHGTVLGWGNSDFGAAPPSLSNIVEISCTQSAYAALDSGGTVRVWGDPTAGGKMGNVSPYGFAELTANGNAFAGRKTSYNSLVAWGRGQDTDLIPPELGGLPGTTHVYGASQAFAVRRLNNPVVAWGRNWDGDYGGTMPGSLVINDAVDIMGSFAAFAVLRAGGQVVAWGNPIYGGTSPNLSGIASLGCSNAQAFCVLTNNQQVQSWGTADYGGGGAPSPNVDIVEVVSTWRAFAARRGDGTVGVWGRPLEGGTHPGVLTRVVQIAGSSEAFAALLSDGSVKAWGNALVGGAGPVLTDALAIYSNSHGFTALTASGDVVSWGHSGGGGNNAAVIGQLRNNVSYYRSPPAPRPLAA